MGDWYWCAVLQGWRTVSCDDHHNYGCGIAPTPPPIVPFPPPTAAHVRDLVLTADDSPRTPMLNEKELAEWLHVAVTTVRNWRYSDTGPLVSKAGKSVRYAVVDVEKWLANNAKTDS